MNSPIHEKMSQALGEMFNKLHVGKGVEKTPLTFLKE